MQAREEGGKVNYLNEFQTRFKVEKQGLKWVVKVGTATLPAGEFWSKISAERFRLKLMTAFADGFYLGEQSRVEHEALLHSELISLKAEMQGPPGFATWKDAALDERLKRVRTRTETLTECVDRIEELKSCVSEAGILTEEVHETALNVLKNCVRALNGLRSY